MKRVLDGFFSKTGIISDPSQRNVVSRVLSMFVNGAIVFTGLGTLGIDTSPLLAAAGITGATIGFACRDYGANIVAGMALVGQPCFRTGKRVAVGVGANRITGVMDHWDVRYLYLRGDDGALLMIPNNYILNSVITIEKPKQEDIEATWKNASAIEGAAVAKEATNSGPSTVTSAHADAQPTATPEDRMWKEAAMKASKIAEEAKPSKKNDEKV